MALKKAEEPHRASDMLRVRNDAIEPPSPMVMMLGSDLVTGITNVGQRLAILLDLGEALSAEEKHRLAAIQQAHDQFCQ
jgi:chemotaxis signal transduction protein